MFYVFAIQIPKLITLFLEQITETGHLIADLIIRQNNLEKMANFMKIKSIKPKSDQSELARELKLSSSTLQRYSREIRMLSPYRIPLSSTTHTRKKKTSNHTEHNLKMTWNDLKKTPQMTSRWPQTNQSQTRKTK